MSDSDQAAFDWMRRATAAEDKLNRVRTALESIATGQWNAEGAVQIARVALDDVDGKRTHPLASKDSSA